MFIWARISPCKAMLLFLNMLRGLTEEMRATHQLQKEGQIMKLNYVQLTQSARIIP